MNALGLRRRSRVSGGAFENEHGLARDADGRRPRRDEDQRLRARPRPVTFLQMSQPVDSVRDRVLALRLPNS